MMTATRLLGAKGKVMIAAGDSAGHEEAWLALPWLANGRLSQVERDKIEPHVRACAACREELAFQRMLCNVLTEPDRVTYAPGPSFRKLMERIDASESQDGPVRERVKTSAAVTPIRRRSDSNVALWRPPGLAWAASFILAVGLGGVLTTLFHPQYKTYTNPTVLESNALHISFNRSVTIGEAEAALRANGARVVEGPDSSGIIGVLPDGTSQQVLRLLAEHLRADPRIRWVQPVPGENPSLPPTRGQ
jgi:hypothetical protein